MLLFISIVIFDLIFHQIHSSNDHRHHVPSSLSENVKHLPNLYRVAIEMAAQESVESSHLEHIIDLLIEFLKLHQTNDAICVQIIELVTIFQRVIQIKAQIFQRLTRILSMIRAMKTIPNGTINRIHGQFMCLQRFTSCINLEMVAKKLASPKVCICNYIVRVIYDHQEMV